MRILQSLTAPRGVLGLTLLAFALGFIALVLDQANFKSTLLAYVFGILAGIAALGALVAFFGPRISRSWAWTKGLLRLAGYPLLFGLLLGGLEWLISASLYDALGIGATAYALTQLAFGYWMPRLIQSQERVLELEDENEQLNQLNKNLQVDLKNTVTAQRDTKREHARLKQQSRADNARLTVQRDALRQENRHLRDLRDGQIKMRCKTLSDRLDKFLDSWEYGDSQNQEAMSQYRQQFGREVADVINDLKHFDLWRPKVEHPEKLEVPESREDIQRLHGYLHWVGRGHPI